MKKPLQEGMTYEFKYTVPENKTVQNLFPEAQKFQMMPKVFASGFLVGLMEWTCIEALTEYLDWPKEQTLGISFNMDHSAATPPGLTVTMKVKLDKIEGKKLTFSFTADDGVDTITKGIHERFIIDGEKFTARLNSKIKK